MLFLLMAVPTKVAYPLQKAEYKKKFSQSYRFRFLPCLNSTPPSGHDGLMLEESLVSKICHLNREDSNCKRYIHLVNNLELFISFIDSSFTLHSGLYCLNGHIIIFLIYFNVKCRIKCIHLLTIIQNDKINFI
jgi:hypothetical protein